MRYERTHRQHGGDRQRASVTRLFVHRSIMLSPDALKRIDREIAKYPPAHRQSAVIAALAIAQDEHAWLSTETMDFVAHYLGMPPIAVYEVATFYEMFDTEPTGKYKLTICTNLPCALSSAAQAAAHLKQKLGIGFGETTADGLFTLKEGECFGACGDAPVVLVNNKRMCSWMKPEQLDGLIAELSAEAKR
jgi:NADH-quinone oxidoreductase subunit E